MSRLTNTIRETIVANALKNAFQKEQGAIEALKAQFAEKAYRHVVSVKEEAQAKLAPEAFRSVCHSAKLKVSLWKRGETMGCATVKDIRGLEGRPMKQVDASNSKYGDLRLYDADALVPLADKINAAIKQLETSTGELRKSVNSIVQSVGTTEKLIAVWPEGKLFIPAEALNPPAKSMLPAVVVSGVNKSLRKAGVQLAA
ncbi:Nmad5 family putative nucleotide modification protein [Cupriavidus metallidurans]|uniref:Nmad5 family putative nucleotide modification protein n=1 Tax=Cupriavidus metallidurans TaxID=119219 RepID=UPI001CCE47B1|nr:Nmad5 family putative nucleotide modification protein [Cupriavidus metallidurans]UBM12693.1 hypothetical protein LAI70_28175 [Cupriavidus metallidurans]